MGLVHISADGQNCRGGVSACHASTGSAEKRWLRTHPTCPLLGAHWDLYHRGATGLRWALPKCKMAMEVIDVYAFINSLLGVGQGKTLLRSVAHMLSAKSHAPQSSAYTRQGTNALRNAEDLVQYFELYHSGMKVRMEQTHVDPATGNTAGSQLLSGLVKIGSRLAAAAFVVCLLGFLDMQRNLLHPLLINTQANTAEGPETQRLVYNRLSSMRKGIEALRTIRQWLHVSVHLIPLCCVRT